MSRTCLRWRPTCRAYSAVPIIFLNRSFIWRLLLLMSSWREIERHLYCNIFLKWTVEIWYSHHLYCYARRTWIGATIWYATSMSYSVSDALMTIGSNGVSLFVLWSNENETMSSTSSFRKKKPQQSGFSNHFSKIRQHTSDRGSRMKM